ncbi:MAG: WG repeat-containing protein [Prevotella sp.]|nr:WG repeat-containing protein [Prevotella sp.]
MMKRKILFLTLSLFTLGAAAQIPSWTIHPKYTSIRMLGNGYYVVSDGKKYGMLKDGDKEALPLQYDSISQFHSGAALLHNQDALVGYVSDRGRKFDLTGNHYKVVGQPFFSDGHVAVHNGTGYYFVRASDGISIGPFSHIIPFTEGYARVRIPESQKKIMEVDDALFGLLEASTGQPVALALGEYDTDDVDFISSVSGGKCIIVCKKRFYEYNMKTATLTPLSTDGDLENKKSRVMAQERPVRVQDTGEGFIIDFKQGQMTFDHLMRLTSITYNGQATRKFDIAKEADPIYESPMKAMSFAQTELVGLSYNGKEILPAQFERVNILWGNQALVKYKGHYGVITVDPQHNCKYVLNNNLDIGFEHQTVNTTIKVVVPPYMKTHLMTLTSQDKGCIINTDTRKDNTNVEASVLSYDCTMHIPEEIDMERTKAYTKFALNYDGLRFSDYQVPYNMWYICNYNVQLQESKTQVNGSALTTEILVRNSSAGNRKFFRSVGIECGDSVISKIEKITEELYSVRFYGWKKEEVRFDVDITEDGCPTITWSFSIPTGLKTTQKTTQKDAAPVEEKPKAVAKAKVKRKAKTAPKKEEKFLFVPN